MLSSAFRSHIENSLSSLPTSVKDTGLPLAERKLKALIHLNTNIYPDLKKDVGMRLDILQMKDGPEKLRLAMLWNIAIDQTSLKGMRAIVKMLDDYIEAAVSS